MATGGRFGPRRTTSSRVHSASTGRPCASASSRASSVTARTPLPAERTAVGERRRGSAARETPARVRFEIRRLDPGRLQGERPVPIGQLDRMAQRAPAASALHLGQPPPRLREVVGHRHRSVVADRDQRPGRCGVAGEPAVAEDHRRSGRLERRSLHLGPPTGQQRVAGRRRPRRGRALRATRAAASTMLCQPVQRHRWANSAVRTESASDLAGFPDRAASRIRIPGVQKPHWLAPASTNASTQRERSAGSRPSTVVTDRPCDPSGRGHTGHPRGTVDPHGAAAALTLGAAAVLDRPAREAVAQDVEQ